MATTNFPKKAEDKAHGAIDKAADTAHQATDKARDTLSSIGQTVSDAASSAASTVGQKAEDYTAAAGQGIRSLAEGVRQHTPREGMLGSASSTVADALDQSGRYIEEQGLSGMADDVAGLVRRNPVTAMLLGIGIGYLLARATTTRS